ncbi:hypothetical protein AAFC00_002594 [Neodothiora populina]|uniref:Uncharacterized protein n=1 Tax=Neodothiora populina TaxID=2781224 RepID=A0ABR3P7L1_9PEZI
MGLPIWNHSDDNNDKAEKPHASKDSGKHNAPNPQYLLARSVIRRRPLGETRRIQAHLRRVDGESNHTAALQAIEHVQQPDSSDSSSSHGSTTGSRDASPAATGTADAPRESRGLLARRTGTRFPPTVPASHPRAARSETLSRLIAQQRTLEARQASSRRANADTLRERAQQSTSRANLPTPPLDLSAPPDQTEDAALSPSRSTAGAAHDEVSTGQTPSPTADTWQVMRVTMTPDETSPSASTSFASARAAADSLPILPDPDHESNVMAPVRADRDVSFDETMREMGIEVSSTSSSEAQSHDSDSDSQDEDMASTGGHYAGRAAIDHVNRAIMGEVNDDHTRRRTQLARGLYRMATTLPAGSDQATLIAACHTILLGPPPPRSHRNVPRHRSSQTSGPDVPFSRAPQAANSRQLWREQGIRLRSALWARFRDLHEDERQWYEAPYAAFFTSLDEDNDDDSHQVEQHAADTDADATETETEHAQARNTSSTSVPRPDRAARRTGAEQPSSASTEGPRAAEATTAGETPWMLAEPLNV